MGLVQLPIDRLIGGVELPWKDLPVGARAHGGCQYRASGHAVHRDRVLE